MLKAKKNSAEGGERTEGYGKTSDTAHGALRHQTSSLFRYSSRSVLLIANKLMSDF